MPSTRTCTHLYALGQMGAGSALTQPSAALAPLLMEAQEAAVAKVGSPLMAVTAAPPDGSCLSHVVDVDASAGAAEGVMTLTKSCSTCSSGVEEVCWKQ